MIEWKELYDRSHRPGIAEIKEFMEPVAFEAFLKFNQTLSEQYNLGYVRPCYTREEGWTYSYGRSGFLLVKTVTFHKTYFTVEGVEVHNIQELSAAVRLVDELFHDGFLLRYAQFCEERTRRLKQKMLEKPAEDESEYKRNCKWCKKVSRNDLLKLYKSDAMGMLDEELLEDIGLTLYDRCKTSREIYDLMEIGKIKCMECGEILSGPGVLSCKCGRVYTYHAYRKSYREDNMPRGAASAVFDRFVTDWERAGSPQEKMRQIDNLVHEFHMAEISGTRGRPVGINLIQGTKKQIVELLCELARG